MREDISILRTQWAPFDKSLTAEQRVLLDRATDDVLARSDQLSVPDFTLAIMRIAAIPRNGHTRARVGAILHDLPIRAWWFADGLYVVSVHSRFANLLGSRIDAFGPLTPSAALARAAPFISGTDQRIRYLSAVYLMYPELLRHIGVAADADDVPLTLRLPDGSTRIVHLGRAESPDPGDRHDPALSGYSALIPDDARLAGRWLHVLDHVRHRPAIYAPPVDLAQHWIGDGGDILYIRCNFVLSLDQTPLDQKLLFGVLQANVVPRRPRFVIVDLRLNNGGNFFNTILFAEALPRLLPPDGRIFVLVSRATFSAALVTAAMLKGHSGDRVTLIGEIMGDDSRFWAENRDVTLPNSRIALSYSTGFHDWTGGCADPQCYWPVVAFGTRTASLEPVVRIEPNFADYAAGRDPVLDAALSMAR
jgi:hypothetical protein